AESKGHDSVNSTNEYFKNKNKFIENTPYKLIFNNTPSFDDLLGYNLFITAENSPTTQNIIDKNFKNESFHGDQNYKPEKEKETKANENKNYNKNNGKVKKYKEKNGTFSCISGLTIIWAVLLWLI
ncbi:hypothetical protein DMUE_5787, partial [Dictyocoela muelleri]